MNKSEMELQAIRKKLESLQSEPPSEEDNSPPWSTANRSRDLPSSNRTSSPEPKNPQLAQFASTVETLKQRANPQSQQSLHLSETAAALSIEEHDRQVELTWRRLGTQAQKINELSLSQESAILEFKGIADQLEREIRKRDRLDHPETYGEASLDASIPIVCEYESAVVPDVTPDSQGRLILSHRPIDLYQAEREATLTAQALRDRAINRNLPFEEPDRLSDLGFSCLMEEPMGFIQAIWNEGSTQVQRLINRPPQRNRPDPSVRRTRNRRSSPSFSWLDATIWFSGAAILRLGLNFLLTAYPVLQLMIPAFFLAAAAIALYRIVFTRHSDLNLEYRLLSAIAGLIVGGRL
ncbi:MAG: hypothetical protein QNJ46_18190 [Leptolyngbyaceae cyanobacterium MO_188.B28]|nr:hypothetical protein [Leptolyngbyaceae cyanobacterium MO_188.B28]